MIRNYRRTLSLATGISLSICLLSLFVNCDPLGTPPEALSSASEVIDPGKGPENSNSIDDTKPPVSVGTYEAKLTLISEAGRVAGWAYDPADKSKKLTAYFYGDGPIGQGVRLGEAVANKLGAGATTGSYFSFQLPAEFRNNSIHELYVYIGSEASDALYPDSPIRYAAYTATVEGMQFFEDTIRPQMAACTSCHEVQHESMYPRLLYPTPFDGATASDNLLISRASGSSHPGGNHCRNGLNSGLCATLQEWWNLEFGGTPFLSQ